MTGRVARAVWPGLVLVLLLEQRTSLARELGLSTGGVKSQVFRARQQLARALTA